MNAIARLHAVIFSKPRLSLDLQAASIDDTRTQHPLGL